MSNPTSFEYNSIIPSSLTWKNIIMMGRSNDPIKRFELGIKAMGSIIKKIPTCEMNIVSTSSDKLEKLIKELNLEKSVRIVGFNKNIDIYLQNSSLHILTSLSESYAMVLGETKLFGIPSIICGLDYLALAKGWTVIIYDDNPETIAKEAIKILENNGLRKYLGKEARKSMKKQRNEIIVKKWVKLLLSVYKGDDEAYHQLDLGNKNKINKKEAEKILKNQLILLQKRIPDLKEITFE